MTCPECKMEHRAWKGQDGRGYAAEGHIYCCQGCFEGRGCECEGLEEEVYELAWQRLQARRHKEETHGFRHARRALRHAV